METLKRENSAFIEFKAGVDPFHSMEGSVYGSEWNFKGAKGTMCDLCVQMTLRNNY